MGCGALCGDTTTLDNTITRKSKIAFERVLQELRENKQLISTEPYSSFLSAYQITPEEFLFKNRPKLIKNDVVTPQILIKWKLVLFGRDRSDQNYRQCLALSDYCEVVNQQPAKGQQNESDSTIVYHQSFIQIEKDIQRTFDVPIDQAKKKQFENVLKRITNHFPKMGYTQGLNFLVSHLLVIGYSQKDSFQIFVHLAINKRYLFLGLYEEGFPLYYIFLKVFQNLLRRLNPGIYEHLFQNLMMDPSMWICQWFMTFFVYSFPKELVKYIFDMILVIGNLGMVLFATSLVLQLSPFLVEKTDIADVGEFLKALKDTEKFNKYINFQNVVSKVYEIELVIEDFNQVEGVHSFYGIYIKTAFRANSHSKRMKAVDIAAGLLNKYQQQAQNMHRQWLKVIWSERKEFKQMNRKTNNMNFMLQIQSASKSNEQLPVNHEYLQQIVFQVNKPQSQETQSTFNKTKVEFNAHPSNKIEYVFNRIKEKIEEEEQSVNSKASYKKSKNSRSIKQQEMLDLEELDKLQLEFKHKKTNLVGAIIHPVRNNYGLDNGKNSIYVSSFNDSNSLSLAGRISMKNDNSYDAISVCSKHNSNRSRIKNNQANNKVVVSKNPRICGCKTKTEENKLSNAQQSIELTQSKYSDKDSISNKNYSQTQQVMNELGTTRQQGGTHRERSTTREDYMINSHGPNMNDKNKTGDKAGRRSQTDIEVVIPQVFKKDKRARVNLVSPTYLSKKEEKLSKIGWEHESIESINQADKLSQVHSHYSGNQCEIESIK